MCRTQVEDRAARGAAVGPPGPSRAGGPAGRTHDVAGPAAALAGQAAPADGGAGSDRRDRGAALDGARGARVGPGCASPVPCAGSRRRRCCSRWAARRPRPRPPAPGCAPSCWVPARRPLAVGVGTPSSCGGDGPPEPQPRPRAGGAGGLRGVGRRGPVAQVVELAQLGLARVLQRQEVAAGQDADLARAGMRRRGRPRRPASRSARRACRRRASPGSWTKRQVHRRRARRPRRRARCTTASRGAGTARSIGTSALRRARAAT